jgi:hypothetical protein
MFQSALALTPVFFLTYLIRFNILGIPTNVLEVFMGILFIWWLAKGPSNRFSVHKKNRLSVTIAILFIVSTTIALFTTVTNLPAEFIKVPLGIWKGWVVAPFLMFIMMISTFTSRSSIEKLQRNYILTAGTYALLAVIQFFTNIFPGPATTYDNRLVWPYFDPWTFEGSSANYPAMFLVPALVLGVFLTIHRIKYSKAPLLKSLQKNTHLILSVIAMCVAIYLTQSFAAWLTVILSITIGLFLQIPSQKKWWIPAGATIALILMVVSQLGSEKFQYFLKTEGDSSTAERIRIYNVSWEMIKQHPIQGIGIGQFQREFEYTAPDVFGRGIIQKEIDHALHAHNIFLMMYLSFGILGLITFLGLIFILLRKNPIDIDVILIVPLVAIVIHGLFDVPYFKNDLAFIFWYITGLICIGKQSPFLIPIKVTKGMGEATKMGFPTVNMQIPDKTPLPYGVYTASLITPIGTHPGVLGYGKRLTQNIDEETCEIHLLDVKSFMQAEGTLEVTKKIRNWKKFKDTDELREAVQKDIAMAIKIHKS